MASSLNRKCSDEELQKALADLDELVARKPIPDEFKFLGPEDEEYTKKKERDKDKKKKKKTCKLLAEDLQEILIFKCQDPEEKYGHKDIPGLEEEREKYKDLKILDTVSDAMLRYWDDFISAGQEQIRQELQTKGYVMFEVTEDEDEQEATAAPQGARGGGGRSPRVTKTVEGVIKKLN